MKEVWQEADSTNGLYQVSNKGHARRVLKSGYRPLKLGKNHSGYRMVNMSINGKGITIPIHILVAKAFIPNPDNKSEVNHIDRNKSHNSVGNLEWCTHTENMQHMSNFKRKVGIRRPVVQMNKEGTKINRYNSVAQAARDTKCNHKSIKLCCDGILKSTGGFKWKYGRNTDVKKTKNKNEVL